MLSATSALAADPGTFNWTGPYVGLNAGDVFNGDTQFSRTTGFLGNNTTALGLGLRPTGRKISDDGFTAGAQVGYNAQVGNLASGGAMVAGMEADIAYVDVHRTETLSNTTLFGPLDTPSTTPFTRVNQYQGKLHYLGTVRGRVGVAFDRVLVYGTGGLAYGEVTRGTVFYGPNTTAPFFAGENNGTKTGYTYGGGVEFAIPTESFLNAVNVLHSSAVTLRAEYLHYDLGVSTLTFPGVNGGATIGGYTSRVRTKGDLARAAINFKF